MVGDVHGFREGMRQALVALPDAHRPLLALRVRLAHADGCDRLGLRSELRLVAGRLRRWQRRPLPALLCARIQAALASAGDGSAHGATERFVRTTGARGIVRSVTEGLNMNALQELSDVLHICHESPDDLTALSQVCVVLRERMRAAAVFAVSEIADHQVLAGAGRTAGSAPETAARAMATGQPIAAALTDAGIEAAAPVRYAGRTIGAIACRWAIDAEVDHQRVTAALATVAAACAPSLRAAIDRLSTPAPPPPDNQAFIGCSSAIQVVRQAVMRAAQAPFAVLVEGESGSGKELVARAVHAQGPRRDRRFCAVNCAALTDELLEAELFGHARGAFTGAVSERAGVFEEADRGTLLLDEVSELSARAQAKLLRAIQEGEIRRVGENLPRRVDVRLIAASNRALATEVAAGRFRADLRYRLDVIRVVVPPLRERVEDIPLLAVHFWNHAIERTNSRATLDPDTLAALARYDWPGNVRELQNVMAALAVQAGPRGRVGARALPAHIAGRAPAGGAATLEEARHAFERRFVRETLARAGGHSGRAARALGISRQGLAKLVRRLGLDAARSANGPDTAVSDASAAGARIEPIP
jgi:two-component system response regulator HydG